MANGFVVDLSGVKDFVDISSWPNGYYAARVTSAKHGFSQKMDPQLELEFEFFSEDLGSAAIKQNITVNMGFMLKPFWIAVNDLTPEEFLANPNANLENPEKFIGSELIIHIANKKSNKPDDNGNDRYFKNITQPFFLPLTRYEELSKEGLMK